jgi:hypothetical protein
MKTSGMFKSSTFLCLKSERKSQQYRNLPKPARYAHKSYDSRPCSPSQHGPSHLSYPAPSEPTPKNLGPRSCVCTRQMFPRATIYRQNRLASVRRAPLSAMRGELRLCGQDSEDVRTWTVATSAVPDLGTALQSACRNGGSRKMIFCADERDLGKSGRARGFGKHGVLYVIAAW